MLNNSRNVVADKILFTATNSEIVKEVTVGEIKHYFDEKYIKRKDVVNISVDTTKEDELFDYVGYERYYGKLSYNELDDDFHLNL